MDLFAIKKLLESGVSSTRIGEELVAAGFSNSAGNARKVVPILKRLFESAEFIPNLNVEQAKDGVKAAPRKIEQDLKNGTAKEVFTVDNPPTSLDSFIEHFETDLTKWEVQSWRANVWGKMYQIRADFRLRQSDEGERIKALINELKKGFNKAKPPTHKGSGVGVIAMADFHYGMKYAGDSKNPEFNVDTLTQSVREVADKINALGLEEVHLALLGDFIESFTGLNHMDAWKHLESYGRDAVIGVSELLRDELILRVKNVKHIYMIAGNHDRVTPKSDIDSKGEAAKLIADFLGFMVDVPISFDYSILNPEIDGIKYILSHGHLRLSKMEEYALILEHGDRDLYNVILQGHGHNKIVRKGYKARRDVKSNVVALEGANFIKMQIAPLVTGGAYSNSIGGYSQTGFSTFRNNGRGKLDYSCLAA